MASEREQAVENVRADLDAAMVVVKEWFSPNLANPDRYAAETLLAVARLIGEERRHIEKEKNDG